MHAYIDITRAFADERAARYRAEAEAARIAREASRAEASRIRRTIGRSVVRVGERIAAERAAERLQPAGPR